MIIEAASVNSSTSSVDIFSCFPSKFEGLECVACVSQSLERSAITDDGCGSAGGIESKSSCRCSGGVDVTGHAGEGATLGGSRVYECV